MLIDADKSKEMQDQIGSLNFWDAQKYQEMQDQIEFMSKVAQGLEDYKSRRIHSLETTFDEVDSIISDSKK
jgi:hypothetical protein